MASLLLVTKREYARAEVRCFLGVTTAGVNRMAKSMPVLTGAFTTSPPTFAFFDFSDLFAIIIWRKLIFSLRRVRKHLTGSLGKEAIHGHKEINSSF